MSLQGAEINDQGDRYVTNTLTQFKNLLTEISIPGTFINNTGISTTVNIQLSRFSRLIVITIPQFSATITGFSFPFYEFSVILDQEFRPLAEVWGSASTIDGAVPLEQGHVNIGGDGIIRVYRNVDHTTLYTLGVVTGANSIGFSYSLT